MRSLILYSAAAVLCGCATTQPPQISSVDPGPPQLGLARVAVRSDVVIIPDEVQHVIYPSTAAVPLIVKPQLASVTKPPAQPIRTSSISAVNVSHPTMPPMDIEPVKVAALTPSKPATRSVPPAAPPSPSEAQVLEAWLKYCKADQEITGADWQIIDTKPVPSHLAAQWSTECMPSK